MLHYLIILHVGIVLSLLFVKANGNVNRIQHVTITSVSYNNETNSFEMKPDINDQKFPTQSTIAICLDSTVIKYLGLSNNNDNNNIFNNIETPNSGNVNPLCQNLNFHFLKTETLDTGDDTLNTRYSTKKILLDKDDQCKQFEVTFNSIGQYCLNSKYRQTFSQTQFNNKIENQNNSKIQTSKLNNFLSYFDDICVTIIPRFLYYTESRVIDVDTKIWQRSLESHSRDDIMQILNEKIFKPASLGADYIQTMVNNGDAADSSSTTNEVNNNNNIGRQGDSSISPLLSSIKCPKCEEEMMQDIKVKNQPIDDNGFPIEFRNNNENAGRIFSFNIVNRHALSPLAIQKSLYLIQQIVNKIITHLTSNDLALSIYPMRHSRALESDELLPNIAERIGSTYSTNELFTERFNDQIFESARLKMPYQLSFDDSNHTLSKLIPTFGHFGKILFTLPQNDNFIQDSSESSLTTTEQPVNVNNETPQTSESKQDESEGDKEETIATDNSETGENDHETAENNRRLSAADSSDKIDNNNDHDNGKAQLSKMMQQQMKLVDIMGLLADVLVIIDTKIEVNKETKEIELPRFVRQIQSQYESKGQMDSFNKQRFIILAPNFDNDTKPSVHTSLPNVHLFSKEFGAYMKSMDDDHLAKVANMVADKVLQYSGRQATSLLEKSKELLQKHSKIATFTLDLQLSDDQTKLIKKDISLNYTNQYGFTSTIMSTETISTLENENNNNKDSKKEKHIRQEISILKADYATVELTPNSIDIANDLDLYDFEFAIDKLEGFDISDQQAEMANYNELHDNDIKTLKSDEFGSIEYKQFNDNRYYSELPTNDVNMEITQHKLRVHHTLYYPFGTKINLSKNCVFLVSVRWKVKTETSSEMQRNNDNDHHMHRHRHHRNHRSSSSSSSDRRLNRRLQSADDDSLQDEVAEPDLEDSISNDDDTAAVPATTAIATTTATQELNEANQDTTEQDSIYSGDFTVHDVHCAEIYYNAGQELDNAYQSQINSRTDGGITSTIPDSGVSDPIIGSDEFFHDMNSILKENSKYANKEEIKYYQRLIGEKINKIKELHFDLIENGDLILMQERKQVGATKQEKLTMSKIDTNNEIQKTLRNDIKEDEAQIDINHMEAKKDLKLKLDEIENELKEYEKQLLKIQNAIKDDESDISIINDRINRLKFEIKKYENNVALWSHLNKNRKKWQEQAADQSINIPNVDDTTDVMG